MISLLWLPIGLILPTLCGWLFLRIIEGRTLVLQKGERVILGFVLGLTATMNLIFFLHLWTGMPLSFLGFTGPQILVAGILGVILYARRSLLEPPPTLPEQTPMRLLLRISIILLGLWTILKIIAFAGDAVLTPTFFDDSIDNWNLRGKIFYVTESFTLNLPFEEGSTGISSYPPTIPLAKAMLATFAGEWNEGLINSIHIVWYLASLGLLYYGLRRYLSFGWALLGTYFLASMPLYLIQGANAYADVFLSCHIFAAVSMAFHGLNARNVSHRSSFFRIGAFAAGLLPFTKNEGTMMYLPVLLILFAFGLLWLWKKRKVMTKQEVQKTILWYVALLVIFGLPWTIYKFQNNLPFGNAKSVTGLTFGWQENVLYSVVVTTFFEGNWHLLIPLFLGLLVLCLRRVLTSTILFLTAFVVIVYSGQLFLFMFTPLSIEALMQTGTGRGVVHVLPVIILITTLLLQSSLRSLVDTEPKTVENNA